ncbi:hypothetical protein CFOL_v3_06934 [Cephalotus follicularis]|uniref:Uncharacterized protein n=1 Tax=Cephalotus follicularis TaxID=3775 RepID=A0A1Q3B5T4_CEPFO|nr:hypothetical protein CFOL_v3_06934 [Cephalotus follicularis]
MKEFGSVGKNLKLLKEELQGVYDGNGGIISNPRMEALKEEINTSMEKEETMWCQRSRIAWPKEGHTIFFHSKTSQRRKSNCIVGLRDTSRRWQEEEKVVEDIVVSYFKDIFFSDPVDKLEEVLD